MPTTSAVSPGAFLTTSARYLPMPSWVMPRSTLTPSFGHVAELHRVVGAGEDRLREVEPDLLLVDVEGGDELDVADVVAAEVDVHQARARSPCATRCGSSARPGRTRRRSCRRRRSRRGPCRLPDRSYGHSCGRFSCPNLLTNFRRSLIPSSSSRRARSLRDVFDVQRAVDLAALAPGADHAADPQHPQVPGDARLAHAQVEGEVVDVLLAHLAEALQDAQAGGIGEGQEVVVEARDAGSGRNIKLAL